MLGIIELGDSSLVLRMIVKVKPLTHWETERDLRRLIQDMFKAQGVEAGALQKVKCFMG
jgi:small-conductance mechanosensitive channel